MYGLYPTGVGLVLITVIQAERPWNLIIVSSTGHFPPRLVVLLEQRLALVVEGCSLLNNGLPFTARDRWSNVKVAVELNEAVKCHQLCDVAVAVVIRPVVVQGRVERRCLAEFALPGCATSSSEVVSTHATAWRAAAYRSVLVTMVSISD